MAKMKLGCTVEECPVEVGHWRRFHPVPQTSSTSPNIWALISSTFSGSENVQQQDDPTKIQCNPHCDIKISSSHMKKRKTKQVNFTTIFYRL